MLSSLARLLTHVYAVYLLVPFLAVEAGLAGKYGGSILGLRSHCCLRRLVWRRCICAYTAAFPKADSRELHIHLYELVQHYLVTLVGRLFSCWCFCLCCLPGSLHLPMWLPSRQSFALLHADELWLALALAAFPVVIGVIALKITHGLFFDRYFLEATAGYAMLVAQATVARRQPRFRRAGHVVSMVALLSADIADCRLLPFASCGH